MNLNNVDIFSEDQYLFMMKNKYLNYTLFKEILILISSRLNSVLFGKPEQDNYSNIDDIKANEISLTIEESFIYLIERIFLSKTMREKIYKQMGLK